LVAVSEDSGCVAVRRFGYSDMHRVPLVCAARLTRRGCPSRVGGLLRLVGSSGLAGWWTHGWPEVAVHWSDSDWGSLLVGRPGRRPLPEGVAGLAAPLWGAVGPVRDVVSDRVRYRVAEEEAARRCGRQCPPRGGRGLSGSVPVTHGPPSGEWRRCGRCSPKGGQRVLSVPEPGWKDQRVRSSTSVGCRAPVVTWRVRLGLRGRSSLRRGPAKVGCTAWKTHAASVDHAADCPAPASYRDWAWHCLDVALPPADRPSGSSVFTRLCGTPAPTEWRVDLTVAVAAQPTACCVGHTRADARLLGPTRC